MSQNDEVFYSSNKSLPDGLNSLPIDARCKMCGCHPEAHTVYFKCPLAKDFLCVGCCQDEIPLESNLEATKKVSGCSTFEEITNICRSCARNGL